MKLSQIEEDLLYQIQLQYQGSGGPSEASPGAQQVKATLNATFALPEPTAPGVIAACKKEQQEDEAAEETARKKAATGGTVEVSIYKLICSTNVEREAARKARIAQAQAADRAAFKSAVVAACHSAVAKHIAPLTKQAAENHAKAVQMLGEVDALIVESEGLQGQYDAAVNVLLNFAFERARTPRAEMRASLGLPEQPQFIANNIIRSIIDAGRRWFTRAH